MFFILLVPIVANAGTYKIDGDFEGCDYDQFYPLAGGGILECQEYNYFYEYAPEVRTDGREVITIGNNKVHATLHNGSVIKTKVDGEFNGCDYDKKINLQNGLVFVCSSYEYKYSYSPEVMIYFVESNKPQVFIKGKKYNGTLYKK